MAKMDNDSAAITDTPHHPVSFEALGSAIKFSCQDGDTTADKLQQLMSQLQVTTPELAVYLAKVIASCQLGNGVEDLNGILAALGEIQCKDPLETLLIVQMFFTNRLACVAMKESSKAILPQDQERQIAIATRLMRLYIQQMESLRKHRNGSSQTINVNYINANQALVRQGG